MSPENARNERDVLRGNLRFHRSMSWALVGALTVALFIIAFLVVRGDRVVITPPMVSSIYKIGSGTSNAEYQIDMARWVTDKLGTVTPETVDANNVEVLKIVLPESVPELRTELDAAAKRVKSERITTIWVPRQYTPMADNKVRIDGRIKTYIANQYTSERERSLLVTFQITFFGRLYVQAVEEIIDERRSR